MSTFKKVPHQSEEYKLALWNKLLKIPLQTGDCWLKTSTSDCLDPLKDDYFLGHIRNSINQS